MKRFTNDLLKVLKAQPSKQISIMDLPLCFEKSLTRHFKISDYGVRLLSFFQAGSEDQIQIIEKIKTVEPKRLL